MRNFTPQFRRILLDPPDSAFIFRPSSLVLACHKGSASQSQVSTPVAAQTSGAAIQGSSNTVDTGAKTSTSTAVGNKTQTISPSARGDNNLINTGTLTTNNLAAGASLSYGIKPEDAQKAIEELTLAITSANRPLSSGTSSPSANPAPPVYTPNGPTAPTTPTTPTDSQPGIIPSSTPAPTTSTAKTSASLTGLQILAALAAIVGTGYLIFKKKRTA